MQFPLIDRQLLSDLRLVHGVLGFVVFLLFLFQARLGLQIRKARKAHQPLPFPIIKRHRKAGPILLVLVVITYFFGVVLVLLDTGDLFEHPFHLLAGSLVVAAGITALILSRKIKGQDSVYRVPHYTTGLALLGLFLVQVFLGIGVLF
ncbi:MAG: hypothetical protein A2010_01715 [Nitrospirae bacterium GWD2_57_9]|nr:MAG: hypothetical protein A2010_01715 [Nitrospirae bacterium GWD2_57_9]OGW49008.1 MAG: hypothetical protein A2078_01540 [Nitrospirae bacterium GWC2_57_9]